MQLAQVAFDTAKNIQNNEPCTKRAFLMLTQGLCRRGLIDGTAADLVDEGEEVVREGSHVARSLLSELLEVQPWILTAGLQLVLDSSIHAMPVRLHSKCGYNPMQALSSAIPVRKEKLSPSV